VFVNSEVGDVKRSQSFRQGLIKNVNLRIEMGKQVADRGYSMNYSFGAFERAKLQITYGAN